MKTYITLLLALLTMAAAQAQDYPGNVNLKGADVMQALNLYASLTGKALVIESGVTNRWKRITLELNPPVSKKEVIKQLESALRTQADVVITPLDDKKLAVKLAKKDQPVQSAPANGRQRQRPGTNGIPQAASSGR